MHKIRPLNQWTSSIKHSQSIWRLYAGRSLVQRSYVMHMQVMSFCVR